MWPMAGEVAGFQEPLVPVRARPGRRRRALVIAAALLPVALVGGVELGALASVNATESDAGSYRDAGDYADAIAAYRSVAGHTGPLYLLAHNRITGAAENAERVYLDWAAALARAGQGDQALLATDRVDLPQLRDQARRARAQIALDAARTAAAASTFDVALHRLDQVFEGGPPADLAAAAAALRPEYGLDGGRTLLAQGRAAQAVAAFDEVIGESGGTPQAQTARGLLPAALLAAGQQSLAGHDDTTALQQLQRLVTAFPAAPQARTASSLLAAPQPVIGTLVRRDGTPVGGSQVRLGSHYRKETGGYLTSRPYYYATTDGNGDFSIGAVPLGGPYVLEVEEPDGWTTVVTQNDDPAYQVTILPLAPVNLAYVVLPQ
jgi:tetratricopeptide (TPR) repeat protein